MPDPVVTVRGLKDLGAALQRLEEAVKTQILADGINAGAEVVALEMAQRAPRRTGRLAKNIETAYSIAYGVADARIGPGGDAFYGGILNQGAKPHRIPKLRRRLRRFERAQGKTLKSINAEKGPLAFGGRVFSRVNHPGVRARPFITTALAASQERAVAAMGRTIWAGIERVVASVPKGGQ